MILLLNTRWKQRKFKIRYILYFLFILDIKTIYTQYSTYTIVSKSAFNRRWKVSKAFFNEKCISDLNSSSKLSILSRLRLKISVNILKVYCRTRYEIILTLTPLSWPFFTVKTKENDETCPVLLKPLTFSPPVFICSKLTIKTLE